MAVDDICMGLFRRTIGIARALLISWEICMYVQSPYDQVRSLGRMAGAATRFFSQPFPLNGSYPRQRAACGRSAE